MLVVTVCIEAENYRLLHEGSKPKDKANTEKGIQQGERQKNGN